MKKISKFIQLAKEALVRYPLIIVMSLITTKSGDYELTLDPESISWKYNFTSQQLIAETLNGRLWIKKL